MEVQDQRDCMEDARSDMQPHCFVLSSYAWRGVGCSSLGVGTLIDCRCFFSTGHIALALGCQVVLRIAATRLGGEQLQRSICSRPNTVETR